MKIYTVYEKENAEDPRETAEFVQEAFSWMAFLFPLNIIWALDKRCWLFLLLIVVIESISIFGAEFAGYPPGYIIAFKMPIYILLGIYANDFRRWHLAQRGYKMVGITSGDREVYAQHRYFDRGTHNVAKS
ncbi:MAG: hypothetical protein COV36_02240 [Alphaproteobacteria bacterium CG11_big_fil_rev_8_21_14_0_20_44_7]|nr:MAG: hypothetical protein COV36_02240 [Alphaproteobacteria bacterium CG11_big_fil_rev_8_21_14_0_20_44_7]